LQNEKSSFPSIGIHVKFSALIKFQRG